MTAGGSFEQQFRGGAGFFVHMLDAAQDKLLVTALPEAAYREASFLDQRILAEDRPRQWLDWSDLADFAGDLPDEADFIFHIGHVGSTLLSRLLGALPTVLPVREPPLLRSFAELDRLRSLPESPWPPEEFDARLRMALGWLSRSFRPGQRAMVKATSFVSEISPAILARPRRALFLTAEPETYLATILAGEASVQELAVLAGPRLARLHQRIGEEPWRLWALSLGERAAISWAAEMTALEAGASAAGAGQVLWMDFEDFLAEPADKLGSAAAHFGQALSAEEAAALVGGPIMQRYSKAPEHGYSQELRRQLLAQARSEHAEELGKGIALLDSAGARYDAVARALGRAAGKG
jgi:hypothetical protein